MELVEELISDSNANHAKAAVRRTVAAAVDVDDLKMRNRESCVQKVMNGDARTG